MYLRGMKRHNRPLNAALLFSVLLLAVPFAVFAQAMSNSAPVQGTISEITSGSITVTGADGLARKVLLTSATTVRQSQTATLDQIKPGDALGVAARRDGDSLIATAINIFPPEVYQAVRKGQFGMTDGQVMTNALVTQYVKAVNGCDLTMTYADGTAKITVPDSALIHRLVAVKVSALAVGQKVTVRVSASAGGGLTATSIGIDPPAKG